LEERQSVAGEKLENLDFRALRKEPEEGKRKGEYFVYAWFILTPLLYLINFLTKDYFVYNDQGVLLNALPEITVTSLEVGGVFIVTRILKLIFGIRHSKNTPSS